MHILEYENIDPILAFVPLCGLGLAVILLMKDLSELEEEVVECVVLLFDVLAVS